ncbi:MAG: hypothetical protein AAF525_02510 [Pseudomonadota bacterium]
MSVELLDTTRFHGFRVRRQIGGKTYQEYFSLKKDGKRLRGEARAKVKRTAEARDEALSRQQTKARDEAARTALFDKGGKVRGILFRMKTEKSGTRTPVFQIGIMSSKAGKIVNTTVSINLHGLAGAWKKAVDFYVEHKKISKRSPVYKKLLKAQPSKGQLDAMKRKSGAAKKSVAKKTSAKKASAKKATTKKSVAKKQKAKTSGKAKARKTKARAKRR